MLPSLFKDSLKVAACVNAAVWLPLVLFCLLLTAEIAALHSMNPWVIPAIFLFFVIQDHNTDKTFFFLIWNIPLWRSDNQQSFLVNYISGLYLRLCPKVEGKETERVKQVSIQARLQASTHRGALQSIFLANCRSLAKRTNKIKLQITAHNLNSCVMVLTEK